MIPASQAMSAATSDTPVYGRAVMPRDPDVSPVDSRPEPVVEPWKSTPDSLNVLRDTRCGTDSDNSTDSPTQDTPAYAEKREQRIRTFFRVSSAPSIVKELFMYKQYNPSYRGNPNVESQLKQELRRLGLFTSSPRPRKRVRTCCATQASVHLTSRTHTCTQAPPQCSSIERSDTTNTIGRDCTQVHSKRRRNSKPDHSTTITTTASAASSAACKLRRPFPGRCAGECEHYKRNCWLKAACCGEYYPCRRCHDENESHPIDRHATKLVGCKVCGAQDQPATSHCNSCGVRFARYFCDVCKFYDDEQGKDIYHCPDCGICRVGKGLNIDHFHCKKCASCVPLEAKDSHPCVEGSLDVDCPICHEYLRTSTSQVVFMRCGHAMHADCFTKYTESRYTCPICSRSLTEMESWYKELDARLADEALPPEYQRKRTKILCNDCVVKSVAKFHFVFHRCGKCHGYNTSVLSHFDLAEGQDDCVGEVLEPSDSEEGPSCSNSRKGSSSEPARQ